MIQERRKDIVSLVRQHGELPVSELAKLLEVSEVTVRSDLKALSEDGQVRRTRGAVRLPSRVHLESPLEETEKQHSPEKRRIGQAAAALIQDGETVFLDVGSTCSEVARHISPALRDVTVVTPSLNIALELERLPNLRIIVTGGTLRRLQHSLVSPYALEILKHIQADRCFIGCNGVDPQHGVTNANHEEAEVKRLMVAHSREVVVLADHSKLGQVSRARIAPLAGIHLITNRVVGHALANSPPELDRALQSRAQTVQYV